MDEKLTIRESEPVLGISRYTIRSLIRSGRIPHYRIGRRIVLSRRELEQWLAARHVAAAR